MKPKWMGTVLRGAVSLAAMGGFLYFLRNEIARSFVILKTDVVWALFAGAVFLYFLAILILSLRIRVVFRVQKILMNFREVVYLNFVALFFNLIFPSAVGGDVAKAYFAYKHSGKKIAATTSVFLDRLIGFVALIVMAMVAVLFFQRRIANVKIDYVIYGFLGLMLFSSLFLLHTLFLAKGVIIVYVKRMIK